MDIYYFSGTHWDREWYQSFQGFRYRLVEMIDDMLDYMEAHPEYETYHFDGQTIVLEDYIAVAPENEGRLRKLIADGRIKIGPWYNMPDEFLVSGESLIRNLMTGHRLAKKWGAEPWKMGYICDIFGHMAQMPQIFNGFGIDMAVLGRGTNENDDMFFDWEAPDGSKCKVFRLNESNGYGFMAPLVWVEPEKRKEALREKIETEIKRSNTDVIILMDANDHMPVWKETPKILEYIKEFYPEANVHHCDLCDVKNKISSKELNTVFGELSRTSVLKHDYLHLITNTLSSYYTHKRKNDICQNILEKRVEPMTAFSVLDGKPFRRTYTKLAYDYLLKNHPHDSICGCSIDQVHKDMIYRFDQAEEIAETLTDEYLASNRPKEGNSGEYILKVYNMLPFERSEAFTAELPLKKDFKTKYAEPFGYEDIASLKIYDSENNEIPYQLEKAEKNYVKRIRRNEVFCGEGYTITFLAKLPPMGYAEYKIVPYEKPSRYLKHMLSGTDYMENDFVRVDISSDGTISLHDKKTGKTTNNLLGLTDDGEIGDGWYHVNPVNDTVVYSKGSTARIEKIAFGAARVVFRITKYMNVPEKMIFSNTENSRSEKYVTMVVVTEVELAENSRFVKVKMTVENNAKDHRLRVCIPTGIKGNTYFTGHTYYRNIRKTDVDYSTQNYAEYTPAEKSMNGIVGKRGDDGCGIAFVSGTGLHECTGYDNGELMITLLSSFKKTTRTMGEERCQLQGKLEYEFMLVPLDNEVSYSNLVKLRDILVSKPIYSVTETEEGYIPGKRTQMHIEGENLNLSIVKLPEENDENALIVRIYNASDDASTGKLCFERDINKVYSVNMNEEIIKEITAEKNSFSVLTEKWKVATYRVEFK